MNAFGKFFISVFTNVSLEDFQPLDSSNTLGSITVTDVDLEQAFNYVEISAGSGPDSIPMLFYKNCWEFIKKLILLLFNLSLSSGFLLKKLT